MKTILLALIVSSLSFHAFAACSNKNPQDCAGEQQNQQLIMQDQMRREQYIYQQQQQQLQQQQQYEQQQQQQREYEARRNQLEMDRIRQQQPRQY
jgi:hypothetical protein